jgi:hypothetical protein
VAQTGNSPDHTRPPRTVLAATLGSEVAVVVVGSVVASAAAVVVAEVAEVGPAVVPAVGSAMRQLLELVGREDVAEMERGCTLRVKEVVFAAMVEM